MDLTTCSVWALAGSAGGAVGGYCTGRRRRRKAAGAGSRPGRSRRRRRTRMPGRSRGTSAMRSWPGGAGHPPSPGDGEAEDTERG
ncbi:hypothetical protein [Pseudonocardia adelaidensis]|uniref:hypothetical protein n=1 Tax=Pseudonocardia adelaidensis TaxID=648754 RepID=UPI0031EC8955